MISSLAENQFFFQTRIFRFRKSVGKVCHQNSCLNHPTPSLFVLKHGLWKHLQVMLVSCHLNNTITMKKKEKISIFSFLGLVYTRDTPGNKSISDFAPKNGCKLQRIYSNAQSSATDFAQPIRTASINSRNRFVQPQPIRRNRAPDLCNRFG